jgi:hypothetical protein
MNNVLRYFYCGAMLLTMHTATHSMDNLSLAEKEALSQRSFEIFKVRALKPYSAQTASFFGSYRNTQLGLRCSDNPINSGCILLKQYFEYAQLPGKTIPSSIVQDIGIDQDQVPNAIQEFLQEMNRGK